MHIHILGICGTFMGGVAQLARALGHRVTGCDAQVYPPMSTQLEQSGIELIEGFGAEQLALKPDLWVVGNVVSRGNPLMEAILNSGQRFTSGPQWVGEHILAGRTVLAVAGTHGKTTTSSLLAWVLQHAGLKPGFLIGGVPSNFNTSAQIGGATPDTAQGGSEGCPFVIEADEYDTAFFDKRSKFLHYRAQVAVINNLEFDHADIFADLAAIETQFHHWVRTLPANGVLLHATGVDAIERVLARGVYGQAQAMGVLPTPSQAANQAEQQPQAHWAVRMLGASHFEVWHQQQLAGQVQWALQGQHNACNALSAIAAAHAIGVPVAQACAALSQFAGVARRMQCVGEAMGVKVFDDFAHHPTAIATTLTGARQAHPGPNARVLAVFEPRSNTMKRGALADALPAALGLADAAWCYTGGVSPDVATTLANTLATTLGPKAQCHVNLDDLAQAVAKATQPGDWVVCMSNGSFGGFHQRLLNQLGQPKARLA